MSGAFGSWLIGWLCIGAVGAWAAIARGWWLGWIFVGFAALFVPLHWRLVRGRDSSNG